METSIVPTSSSAETKLKSYWNRPGGKFGTIVGVGLLGAVAYFVIPILAAIAWSTVSLLVAAGTAWVLFMALSNRKLRLSVFYLYEILMKKLVGVVIELDPFIIAENYIKDMLTQRDDLYKQTRLVGGQLEKINIKVEEKNKSISDAQRKLQAAADNKMAGQISLLTRQIGRDQEYIKNLTPIRANLEKINTYLMSIWKNSEFVIADAQAELENRKDLYNTVTAGNRAMKSALSIFKGDPEKKLLVDQSMEFLKDDIANKLGEMRQAMDVTSDIMKNIDLDNATFEIAGMEMLETLSPSTTKSLASSGFVAGKVNTSQYDNLLK